MHAVELTTTTIIGVNAAVKSAKLVFSPTVESKVCGPIANYAARTGPD